MTKWSIEISKFGISFEPLKVLMAQDFEDFIVQMMSTRFELCTKWAVFINGSSNNTGNKAKLIMKGDKELIMEVSLHLEFTTTNNQVEYKAFIIVITLA